MPLSVVIAIILVGYIPSNYQSLSHAISHTTTTQDRFIVVTPFQRPSAQWLDKHWSAATTIIIKTIRVSNRSKHMIVADFVVDSNDDIFTKQHPETALIKIKQLVHCVAMSCHKVVSCVLMFHYYLIIII